MGHINNMSAEMDFIANSQKEQKRANANVKRKELTSKIRPTVFPCDCEVESEALELDVDDNVIF